MQLEPEYRYVALLDVLGYKLLLEKDRHSGKLDFKDSLENALRIFESIDKKIISVQAISDTIVIICNTHQHFIKFLKIIRSVFMSFLSQGLFIRGGIAYSRHYQNNHLTYSHAIAKAYELEQSRAIYPRIVIDDNIIQMYKSGEGLPDIETSGLICFENGTYFLQILTYENWVNIYDNAKRAFYLNRTQLERNEGAYIKHLRFQWYVLSSEFAPNGTLPYIPTVSTPD